MFVSGVFSLTVAYLDHNVICPWTAHALDRYCVVLQFLSQVTLN